MQHAAAEGKSVLQAPMNHKHTHTERKREKSNQSFRRLFKSQAFLCTWEEKKEESRNVFGLKRFNLNTEEEGFKKGEQGYIVRKNQRVAHTQKKSCTDRTKTLSFVSFSATFLFFLAWQAALLASSCFSSRVLTHSMKNRYRLFRLGSSVALWHPPRMVPHPIRNLLGRSNDSCVLISVIKKERKEEENLLLLQDRTDTDREEQSLHKDQNETLDSWVSPSFLEFFFFFLFSPKGLLFRSKLSWFGSFLVIHPLSQSSDLRLTHSSLPKTNTM